MIKCGPDEKNIEDTKFGAKVGISVITIIYFVYLIFIIGVIMSAWANTNNAISKKKADNGSINNSINQILNYVKSIGKGEIAQKPVYTDNFTGRFTEWFTKVGNSINAGSVLAILAAGVVIGFNGLIMTPIISTMFPVDIAQAIAIAGRTTNSTATVINPGQFFIALIGFILSLILFFFVAEVIYAIRRKFKQSLTIIILIVLFIFLTFMLVWNATEVDKLLKLDDCIPLDKKTTVFQLKNPGTDSQTNERSNLPPFGVFG
jgi:flagellar basal body-associated protein FliL